jgi:hypothetical protein
MGASMALAGIGSVGPAKLEYRYAGAMKGWLISWNTGNASSRAA